MSPKDSLDGRPDFTAPSGKPLDPNTIVPDDDAALNEPLPENDEVENDAEESPKGNQPPRSPDDERIEGIPASWSEG